MKTYNFLLFLVLAFYVGSSFFACSPKQKKLSYNNPLVEQRADPWVYKHTNGIYYYVATAPEYDRIEIRSSENINGLKLAKPVIIWRKHKTGTMGHHIWAPELHYINNKWYIYFAAGNADEIWKIRIWVLSNNNPDPTQGEWVEEGQVVTQRNDFALDATTFEINNQRYLIWAERASQAVTNTGLIIAKLKNPVTLHDSQIVISQPELDWEIKGHRVNEGPAVLMRNGKIFVTYSASATDHNYAIGMLWANIGDDLLNPVSWNKMATPVFYTNDSLKRFGPGHNCFTIAEDGVTDIMVYHARDYKQINGEPLHDPNRNTRARAIGWDKNGFPVFNQNCND